ncbi:MAG TPA: hypothetical protein VKX25_02515 [Bryobacteraceae bacterium]|jgi:flagellar export protein FliJ|nr:hypothetical protein [Bryobacteraceae bacterium]
MPTAFKFRLDPALRLRHLETEQERARLQELIAREKRLEKSLADLWQERTDAADFVRSSEEPGAQDVRALALFSIGLKARAKQFEDAIKAVGWQIVEQKRKVLAAERNERSLEKLKEKRQSEWNTKISREIEAASQELWLAARTNSLDGRHDDSSTWNDCN